MRNARATDPKLMLEYLRVKARDRRFQFVFSGGRHITKKQLTICLMLMGCLVLVEPFKGSLFVVSIVSMNIILYLIHIYIRKSKTAYDNDLQYISRLTAVILAIFLLFK
jgi:hypothetical protein